MAKNRHIIILVVVLLIVISGIILLRRQRPAISPGGQPQTDLSKRIDEIDSLTDDLGGLNKSINEFDENLDLGQIFQK